MSTNTASEVAVTASHRPLPLVSNVLWRAVAACALAGLSACSGKSRPCTQPPSVGSTFAVANGSTVDYGLRIDGAARGTVPAGKKLEVRLDPGSYRVELEFKGSGIPACDPLTVSLSLGQTRTLTCSSDCQNGAVAGLHYTNKSPDTRYDVSYRGELLATLDPGETTGIVRVPAGSDRLEAVVSGTSEVACSSTVTSNRCKVGRWSCSRRHCEIRGTGQITVKNGYDFLTILEIADARITLTPGQRTEPLTLPAGRVTIRLRQASSGRIVCEGPVEVVKCGTRSYECNP